MIESYELAFRMQKEMPQVMDLSKESDATKKLYGLDNKDTADFGQKCLLARRFVEAGVRFVEVSHGDWDQHFNLTSALGANCRSVDHPIAGLLTDLKERGYDKAGLYDPQGVGGTHVMYVLHHADKPSLYHGLPDNPTISPLVSLWKGIAKPLATLALAGVALGSLFHYVIKGPNEVSKEIEDEIEKEDAK